MLQLFDHMLSKDIKKLRIIKYCNTFIPLGRMAHKPIHEMDRRDIEKLIARINSEKTREATKRDYRIITKKYFQGIRGCSEEDKEYPEEVRWIKTTEKKEKMLPEVLLSKEELRRLVDATENERDRAFLLVRARVAR